MRKVLAKMLPRPAKSLIRRLAPGRFDSRSKAYTQVPLRLAPRVRMDLIPGDVISDSIQTSGTWEDDTSRRLIALAERGGTFVQVGANLGYFGLLWAAHGTGQVFAFEPSERNVALLSGNVRQNGFGGRVHVLPVAAGRATEIAYFDDGPPEQSGWGGLSTGPAAGRRSVVVVRLDDLFRDTAISLLMIDTEGADTWVLYGCERMLRERRVGAIFYEQNRPRMHALGIADGEAEQFLRSVGYEPVTTSEVNADVSEWRAAPTHR